MKFCRNILLTLSVICLSNCTDLTEEPHTFLAPDTFYKNADELEMAVMGVYDSYQNTFARNYIYNMILEVLTEFGAPAYAKDNVHLWNAWSNVNSSSNTINIWLASYQGINRANVVLGRGESIQMDETLKARLFAEARFLRAITYFNLVRIYGGVPIPQSYTASKDGLELPRKSVGDTYDYIIADLEYAEANLPLKSQYTATDKWRPAKGTAQAFLGEVYLTRASMENNNAFYQKAKDYCSEVIASAEYALEPDFKDLWYWWNTGNKNGVESIFEIQSATVAGSESNPLHVYFGVNITEATLGMYMYRRMGPTISAYESYSDLDARKEATFLTTIYRTEPGNINNVIDTLVFLPEDKGFYPGSEGWTTASPGNVKFYDRSPESRALNRAQPNYYIMRYADVLLNYAEAENQLNGPTVDALSKLNAVRNRADLSSLSGLSMQGLDDAIFQERGWEFIGESQLYFDELRTDRLGKNVKAYFEQASADGIFMYKDAQLEFVPDKTFLWKIPQYDLDSNPALDQNPDNIQD